ncbi:MAG: CHAT domain-containing protein [Oculatellaceae cyanobacterium Prado106]|jgi:CHAT domain-containing protein|nr:CHAT domain-containing protein [Oculatellaceae cyanobacterium Prado106]
MRLSRPIRFAVLLILTLTCVVSAPIASYSSTPTPPAPLHDVATRASHPTALEQQARSLFNTGSLSEAALLFQQAAQAYADAGEPLQQALSLSNYALAAQQLGQWTKAKDAIATSLTLVSDRTSITFAQILDMQARLLLDQGQADTAIATWKQAAQIYEQRNQPEKALQSQLGEIQALQSLGLYRQAIALLTAPFQLDLNQSPETLQPKLTAIPPSDIHATYLRTLGESLRVIGQLDKAAMVLQQSLAIAQTLQQPEAIALTQISLGNLARSQSLSNPDAAPLPQSALDSYAQAASTATSPFTRTKAQLNQLSLLVELKQSSAAQSLIPAIQQQIATLPSQRASIELRINLAQTLINLGGQESEAAKLLATAMQQAKALGDSRLIAYATGSLGSIYERTQQWTEAAQLTEQAVQQAQQINATEITYRWQWQLGRILKAQGKTSGAIAAYKEAVSAIKLLRSDLAAASPDVQFVFRDTVDPIHRELVELLVESNQADDLTAARDVIESLQLVELDNFFREACLNADPAQIDDVDAKAAVIYPILLKDQLSIIVSLPNPNPSADAPKRQLKSYKVPVPRSQVETLAARIREDLDQANTGSLTLPWLQQMYDWLIRPEAADLAMSQVETLVFVLDGGLRNIPMSALHDGQQYILEQYSVALTPGLQLLAPRAIAQRSLNVLAAGLDAARPPFDALPSVDEELNTIETEISSEVLFNERFTRSAFQRSVERDAFSVVHLATHGQFSSNAQDTFVLAWDDRIPLSQLSSTLESTELSQTRNLELLVLSACETAAGDNRAALGLAGVAVRSGARSTIATLWRINDEASAQLMGKFYEELAQIRTTGISKAEALRRAQLSVLQNPDYAQEPFFWSAYTLVGNWL